MNNPFERELKDFKVEKGGDEKPSIPSSVPEPDSALVVPEKRELMNLFGLTRQLFDFAADNDLEHKGGYRYADVNNEFSDNPFAKDLPQKFYPIIAEYPGKYFVVSYENRLSSYYAEGTRLRMVRLSNVRKQSETDERVREITITEYDPSEGKGNVQFLTIKDFVNNQKRTKINTAAEGEVDDPNGSARLTYELDPTGGKKLIASEFDRMDEGMFEWHGELTPVRWNRRLDIEKQGTGDMEMRYRDYYIIGRNHYTETHKDYRIQAEFVVIGNIDNPQSIVITFGSQLGDKKEVIFEDKENQIIINLNDGDSWTKKEKISEFIKQDPNFSFLFDGSASREKIIELIRRKADALTNEWDKPTHVFAQNELREGDKSLN